MIVSSTLPAGWVPKAVFFDLDDTLCDYAGARRERLRFAFLQTGDPRLLCLPPEEMDALVARSIAIHPHGVEHFPELLAAEGVGDREAHARAMAWYRKHRFHGLALFPDAVQVVAATRCNERGRCRPVGIITNGPAEVQRAKLDLLGIEGLVDFALVSGEFGVGKPDPAIFGEALRRAGASPSESLMVGDTLEFDVAGAQAAGVRSVWLSRAEGQAGSAQPAPDAKVTELADVLALFGGQMP